MDALALGGAGACALRIPALRQLLSRHLRALAAIGLVPFLVGIPLTHVYDAEIPSGETLGYSILALSSAVFVTWAALCNPGQTSVVRALAWTPLRSCGKYSYGMYVFHNLLHKLVGEPWLASRFGEQPPAAVVLGYALAVLLISYLLAFCSYHALEKHFLHLKSAFESGKRLPGPT